MKLKVITNKIDEYTTTHLFGEITCKFKGSEMTDALVAFSNKIKELSDQYGALKIRFFNFSAWGVNQLGVDISRKLTDKEKVELKDYKKNFKEDKLKRERREVKKRAKELGIIK